ncbi:hypothetical protein TUMSATVNIG1_58520 (plasmid) [Vibrio nigripulchritudo]|uniref:HIT family hydrolase n=1 Tax=Vibrio nigripulchritudo SOn1 TaxID=1238450 RepID=A0AAV2W0H8_9VIBR|nr:hydrolase [Vibrio nigripulchritudo]BCL73867.1 hypothetical protein VNTUMSATTG_58040 [Vibrio nigripulchritudo]BDU35243.1 hypothetical protein TUMSATVNIG1_58520 [Vibrio nigripulchritudo]CCO50251.1 putative HIT family hydrolase [Vibrio nigripulchritudo SOn1]
MECFVCKKHRDLDKDLELFFSGFEEFVVSHAPDRTQNGKNFIGSLIVEPKRHVKNWAALSEDESAKVGLLIRRVNECLYRHPKVEHVYTWVFGDAVEHLHIWVVPRYIGTKKAYWGVKFAESPDAPLGGLPQMKKFIAELREIC